MDGRKKNNPISRAESAQILREAQKILPDPHRRLFLKRGLTLGALAMLSGCDLVDGLSIEKMLRTIASLNERVETRLFDPSRLAPVYPESMIMRPFRTLGGKINGQYPLIGEDYRLELSGLIANKTPVAIGELLALPQTEQITRLICVKGWSAIGKWGGVSLGDFLRLKGADLTAKFVGFNCADGWSESIDMASALHPQTMLALTCNGETLQPQYGYPLRLRVPTKLGYKNPKHIVEIFVANSLPEVRTNIYADWFGGL